MLHMLYHDIYIYMPICIHRATRISGDEHGGFQKKKSQSGPSKSGPYFLYVMLLLFVFVLACLTRHTPYAEMQLFSFLPPYWAGAPAVQVPGRCCAFGPAEPFCAEGFVALATAGRSRVKDLSLVESSFSRSQRTLLRLGYSRAGANNSVPLGPLEFLKIQKHEAKGIRCVFFWLMNRKQGLEEL